MLGTAVLGLAVAGAIAVVMIARPTPVDVSGSDRGAVAACRTDVANIQTAVDAYRNNLRTGSPPGSADEQGRPGAPPTIAQLVNYGYLHSAPAACASYEIDGTTGVVSAVTRTALMK
jgi:hypothetical protein